MKRRNGFLTAGLVLTCALAALILLGFFWTPWDPNAMSADRSGPSLAHLMGTDNFGRDILSRVMKGAGTTASIALATVAIGAGCGTVIGALTGYFGGIVDEVLMRINDALTAFPSVLLALVVISVLGPGKQINVILALGLVFIPGFARIARTAFAALRDVDYVKSAQLLGAGRGRILLAHILPNVMHVLLPALTIGFNNAVLAEASMSYLGIGVNAAEPSLGYLLKDGQGVLFTLPWCAVFPGLAAILLILGVSLLGEGIQERMGGTAL